MFQNSLFNIRALSLCVLLAGCAGGSSPKGQSSRALKSEGVSQGNGMVSYASKTYKYIISYDSRLRLSEAPSGEVSIDNSSIISANQALSSLQLRGLSKSELGGADIRNLNDLSRFLAVKQPSQTWQTQSFSGVQGLSSVSQGSDSAVGDYYILLGENDIIYGHLDAHEAANGLAAVAPIINTLQVDTTPPTVAAIQSQNQALQAGTAGAILFKGTDDVSGIDLDFTFTQGRFQFSCASSPCVNTEIDIYGPAPQALGSDWYSISFDVGKFVPPGDYYLGYFIVQDNAGNRLTLTANSGDSNYHVDGSGASTNIPVVHISVVNPGVVDTHPPTLLELKAVPAIVQAGGAGALQFKAIDDVSGLNLTATFSQGRFTSAKNPKSEFDVYGTAPVATGGDRYSLSYSAGRYLLSGEYYLRTFILTDNAGNQLLLVANESQLTYTVSATGAQTTIPVVRIQVQNSVQDATAPVVSGLKLQAGTVSRGSLGTLLYHATDSISGLNLSATYTQGRFKAASSSLATGPTIDIYGPAPQPLGNDWFSIGFSVSDYLPPGQYFLDYFFTFNNAGLRVQLKRQGGAPNYVLDDGTDSGVPVVMLTVQ